MTGLGGRPHAGNEARFYHGIDRQRAYNEGVTATLAGDLPDDCPYNNGRQLALRCEWMAGYYDTAGVTHG